VSLSPSSGQLAAGFFRLEFIDVLKQAFDLFSASNNVFVQLLSNLITTCDLGFQVTDSAVDIANRPQGCIVGCLLGIELVFKLGRC
ncbi:MAG: hypothetical protein Q9190_006161, partial [Brigantiaea leucoxantha]